MIFPDLTQVIRDTFLPYATSGSLPQRLVPDLWELFSTKRGYALYPDVLPFFNSLRETRNQHHSTTVASGIITNSDDRVPSILSSLGLLVSSRRYGGKVKEKERAQEEFTDIDFVTMSYDVGHSKPSREIFDAAFQLSGFPSFEESQHIHVGDDVHQDYYGAVSAGWQGLLLEDRGEPPDDLMELGTNVVSVRDLLDLKEVLRVS